MFDYQGEFNFDVQPGTLFLLVAFSEYQHFLRSTGAFFVDI